MGSAGAWVGSLAIAFLLLILAGLPSAGAVGLDAISVESGDLTLASTSFEHETPSGEDRLLLVSASWDDANDVKLSSVTYAGNELSCLEPAKQATKIGSQMCYLVAPPTGANTLELTWGLAAPEWGIVARSLSDVDQGQPIGATSSTTGTGTTAVDTLTTEEPDSAVFAHLGTENADITLDPAYETDEDADTSAGVSSLGISAAAGRVNTTTAGDHDIGWNLSSAEPWALVPAEILRSPEQLSFNNPTSSVDETTTPASIDIVMDRQSSGDVKVDYELTGGNASSDDHNFSAGTATINAGETSTTVTFDVTDDTSDEPSETIEITLKNPLGGETSSPTTHTLTIVDDDANSPPNPDGLSVSTDEDTDLSDQVTASDPDQNDAIDSFAVDTSPSHGSLSLTSGTGEFTYSPDKDYNGADSFTFTATDEHGATSTTATVDLTINSINDAPSASSDSASMDEDGTMWVDVLSNDVDADGDTLSIDSVTSPSNGATSLPGNGTIKYTPDADWSGEDSFSYDVSDGSLTDTGTVSLTVNAVNDAPSASDDTASMDEDGTMWVDVLSNDVDVDGDPLSVASVTDPLFGSTSIAANGTVAYTPSTGFTGTDTFTYQVTDGKITDQASITVSVGSGAIEVLASSVRVLEGNLTGEVSLETTPQGSSSLMFQLENASDGIELDDLNASPNTTFEVNMTIANLTPRVLMGRGSIQDWTNTTNENGTENISLQIQPIQMAFIDDCESYDPFMGYCGPASVDSWPTSALEDRADVNFDAALRVFLSDLSYLPADERSKLDGAYMTTDAQAIGQLNITGADSPQGASLTIPVAGPHVRPDGSTNNGFFEAYIPPAMLEMWGIEDISALSGTYEGENRTVTVENRDGGVLVDMDVHYSSGTVTIGEDKTDPKANAGEDQTVTEGTTVKLDAGNSTDNQEITAYEWQLGDGTNATGETVEHTYTSSGTFEVVLTVTDGANNTDKDTLNLTVEAANSGRGGGGPAVLGSVTSESESDADEADEEDNQTSETETTNATESASGSSDESSGVSPGGTVEVQGEDNGAHDRASVTELGEQGGEADTDEPAGPSDRSLGERLGDQRLEVGVWASLLGLLAVSVLGVRRWT